MPLLARFSPFTLFMDDVMQFRKTMDQVLGNWANEPVTDNPCVSAGNPAVNLWQDDACFNANSQGGDDKR